MSRKRPVLGPALDPASANSAAPSLWRAIAGFIIWAIAFVVLYVGHALACRYVINISLVSATLVLLWAIHLAWVTVLAGRSYRHVRRGRSSRVGQEHLRFMWRVTMLLDFFSVGAVFLTGLPVLAVPACLP